MKKYLVEFIGTFFLVLTVGLSQTPLAVGAVLVAMVYMGGYISGAHYNPAVTLAVWVRGKITRRDAVYYMVWQLAGAVVASMAYFAFKGMTMSVAPGPDVPFSLALVAEIIFTFALASVVLHSAVSDRTKGNDYYGLAIGLTVLAGGFSVGAISGGAFNPAVGVGPLLYDFANLNTHMPSLALYILGPFIGAWLAATVHKYVSN